MMALSRAPWRNHEWVVSRNAAVRRRRLEQPPVEEAFYDDRAGHCWRCSHQTRNEDRTCDFCLIEVAKA